MGVGDRSRVCHQCTHLQQEQPQDISHSGGCEGKGVWLVTRRASSECIDGSTVSRVFILPSACMRQRVVVLLSVDLAIAWF